MKPATVFHALEFLRNDAIANGLRDLAIVYGWSLIRLKEEEVRALLKGHIDGKRQIPPPTHRI